MELHRIQSLFDPFYEFFLDGLQAGFPPDEQTALSLVHRIVRDWTQGTAVEELSRDMRLLVALDDHGEPFGLAMWRSVGERIAHLWYLWVTTARRDQGLGAWLYTAVRQQAREAMPGARLFTFEVERSDQAVSPHQAEYALRRIGFYRRLGAKMALNVDFVLDCGREGASPLPMHLMAHTWDDVAEAEVLDLLAECYGQSMVRPPTLELA